MLQTLHDLMLDGDVDDDEDDDEEDEDCTFSIEGSEHRILSSPTRHTAAYFERGAPSCSDSDDAATTSSRSSSTSSRGRRGDAACSAATNNSTPQVSAIARTPDARSEDGEERDEVPPRNPPGKGVSPAATPTISGSKPLLRQRGPVASTASRGASAKGKLVQPPPLRAPRRNPRVADPLLAGESRPSALHRRAQLSKRQCAALDALQREECGARSGIAVAWDTCTSIVVDVCHHHFVAAAALFSSAAIVAFPGIQELFSSEGERRHRLKAQEAAVRKLLAEHAGAEEVLVGASASVALALNPVESLRRTDIEKVEAEEWGQLDSLVVVARRAAAEQRQTFEHFAFEEKLRGVVQSHFLLLNLALRSGVADAEQRARSHLGSGSIFLLALRVAVKFPVFVRVIPAAFQQLPVVSWPRPRTTSLRGSPPPRPSRRLPSRAQMLRVAVKASDLRRGRQNKKANCPRATVGSASAKVVATRARRRVEKAAQLAHYRFVVCPKTCAARLLQRAGRGARARTLLRRQVQRLRKQRAAACLISCFFRRCVAPHTPSFSRRYVLRTESSRASLAAREGSWERAERSVWRTAQWLPTIQAWCRARRCVLAAQRIRACRVDTSSRTILRVLRCAAAQRRLLALSFRRERLIVRPAELAEERRHAAIAIQSAFRAHRSFGHHFLPLRAANRRAVRAKEAEEREADAATCIACAWRQWRAARLRQRRNLERNDALLARHVAERRTAAAVLLCAHLRRWRQQKSYRATLRAECEREMLRLSTKLRRLRVPGSDEAGDATLGGHAASASAPSTCASEKASSSEASPLAELSHIVATTQGEEEEVGISVDNANARPQQSTSSLTTVIAPRVLPGLVRPTTPDSFGSRCGIVCGPSAIPRDMLIPGRSGQPTNGAGVGTSSTQGATSKAASAALKRSPYGGQRAVRQQPESVGGSADLQATARAQAITRTQRTPAMLRQRVEQCRAMLDTADSTQGRELLTAAVAQCVAARTTRVDATLPHFRPPQHLRSLGACEFHKPPRFAVAVGGGHHAVATKRSQRSQ